MKQVRISMDIELYKSLKALEESEGIGVTQLLRIAIHNLDADWATIKPKYMNVDGKTEPALDTRKMRD